MKSLCMLPTEGPGYILSTADRIFSARTGNISLTPQIWGSQKMIFRSFIGVLKNKY